MLDQAGWKAEDVDLWEVNEAFACVAMFAMRDIGIPNGLAEVGFGAADVDDLVAGAMKQQRLLATAPRTVREEDLAAVFTGSMEHW